MKKLFLTIILGIIAVSSYSQFNLIKAISWPLVCGQPILAGFNVRIPTEDSAFYYYSIGKCSPSTNADNKIYRADSSFHNNFTIFTSNTIEGHLIKLVSCPNGHCCYNYCETGYNITTLKKYLTSSGWSDIGTPSNLFSMQFLNDHNGFAITSTGLFYRYKNDTLSALYTIPSCYDPRINFKNVNLGYIICKDTTNGAYNKILKTNDNGSSWTTILHNSIDTLSYLRFINDSCFLLITHTRGVYKSTDQGLNWNYLLQIPSSIGSYSFVNDSIIFGLNGNIVMKTTNSGNTWEIVQTITPVGNFGEIQTISMVNDTIGYIFGTGSGSTPMSQWEVVYKTTNGCYSLDLDVINGGINDTLFVTSYPITLNANSGFKSYSWSNGSIIQSTQVSSNGWYSVTVSNNKFILTDSIYVLLKTDVQIVSSEKNIFLFPNPTNGQFTIELDKEQPIEKLEILSILGENIYPQIANSKLMNLTIDISDSPNGIYFVKIYLKENIYLEKIIKQ